MRDLFLALESNEIYQTTTMCEPQLGRYGLYPTLSRKEQFSDVMAMKNLLAYADGSNDLIDISNIIGVDVKSLTGIVDKLIQHNLLRKITNDN